MSQDRSKEFHFREALFRWTTRRLAPELAEAIDRDGTPLVEAAESADFLHVEDRGAPVTLVIFAGLAALYAGLPRFEFRYLMRAIEPDCNLLFVRDPLRMSYHVCPDGSPAGLEFYSSKIAESLHQLRSHHHVALGVSMGGAAAMYFGGRLGFAEVLAFSPAYPPPVYFEAGVRLKTFGSLTRLRRSPEAYREQVLVSLAAQWYYRRLCRAVGEQNYWDIPALYGALPHPPHVQLFYGTDSPGDARQAELLQGLPGVELVPLETPLHNCAMHLKQQGKLGATIRAAIIRGLDQAVTESDAASDSVLEVAHHSG